MRTGSGCGWRSAWGWSSGTWPASAARSSSTSTGWWTARRCGPRSTPSPPPISPSRFPITRLSLIIQPGYPGIPVAQFTRVNVAAKEFSGPAWIWVSTRQWSEPAYLPPGPGDPREAGGWRIVARLGEGQAGAVYLAHDGGAGGQPGPGASAFDGAGGDVFGDDGGDSGAVGTGWAAVKVFDQQLTADPDVARRLPVGALAASVVRHPHLASVIDCDAKAGQWPAVGGEHPGARSLARRRRHRDGPAARGDGGLDRPRRRRGARHAARDRPRPPRGLRRTTCCSAATGRCSPTSAPAGRR